MTTVTSRSSLYPLVKRLMDLVIATGALVVLAPILAVLAALVALRLGRPVFFVQLRGGLHGVPFRLLKFRTMIDARDGAGVLLPDARRLTPFGAWLRATSLDELPELINIVRGKMSLVGPRPLVAEYLPLYSPQQARRHDVRPGLTGWAQVNGRNALGWDRKFELDIEYVERCSLRMDATILMMTVSKVLAREGIDHATDSPMPPFTGPRLP